MRLTVTTIQVFDVKQEKGNDIHTLLDTFAFYNFEDANKSFVRPFGCKKV